MQMESLLRNRGPLRKANDMEQCSVSRETNVGYLHVFHCSQLLQCLAIE